jgi:hypothetical protein
MSIGVAYYLPELTGSSVTFTLFSVAELSSVVFTELKHDKGLG